MSARPLVRFRARRGVALIAALWLVVAIAVVALQFGLVAKERRVLGLTAAERGIGRGAALGALALTQARLDYLLRVAPQNNAALSSTRSGDPWLGVDSIYSGPVSVDSMRVDAQLLDLGRRLNVNDLTEDQLRAFLGYVLNDYITADHLAQTIMDWEDVDDIARPNGDEQEGYIKKGLLALPANAPFRSLNQLLDVEGMTPAIYAQISPYLTVYGSGTVNINTAPVPVLRAIPGMTDQILANILNQRSRGLRISSIAQVVPGYAPTRGRGANAGLSAMAGIQQAQLARAMTVNTNEILATFTARGGRAGRAHAGQGAVHEGRYHGHPCLGAVVMPRASMFDRRPRVGLALSAAEITGAWRTGGALRLFRAPVAAYPGENGAWPGLVTALDELRRTAGIARGGQLSVALLPPLVEVRRVELPPLEESELAQLLARHAGRYFVGARGAQVAGALVPRGRHEGTGPVLAASASARLLNALHHAARDAGWAVSLVVPAEGAWAAAAVSLWPSFARQPAQVLVREADRTALVALEGGRAVSVRRFRNGGADVELVGVAIAESFPDGAPKIVGAVGMTPQSELRRELAAIGVGLQAAPGAWAAHATSPEVMAAAFADRVVGPRLIPEEARAEQRARVARATAVVAAAAVLLFVAAAGVALWGVNRDLRQVRAERAAIRSQVSATLVGRTSVEDAYRRIAALAAAQREAPHWAPVLADLSARVPDDAYLTAFHVHGDSLVVDGMATSAARVFDAIEQSPVLMNVRAPAPVRREAQVGSPPMERFTIAAQRRGAPRSEPGSQRARSARDCDRRAGARAGLVVHLGRAAVSRRTRRRARRPRDGAGDVVARTWGSGQRVPEPGAAAAHRLGHGDSSTAAVRRPRRRDRERAVGVVSGRRGAPEPRVAAGCGDTARHGHHAGRSHAARGSPGGDRCPGAPGVSRRARSRRQTGARGAARRLARIRHRRQPGRGDAHHYRDRGGVRAWATSRRRHRPCPWRPRARKSGHDLARLDGRHGTRAALAALVVGAGTLAWTLVDALRPDVAPAAAPAVAIRPGALDAPAPPPRVDVAAAVAADLFVASRTAPRVRYSPPGEVAATATAPSPAPAEPVVLGTAIGVDGASFATCQFEILPTADGPCGRSGGQLRRQIHRARERRVHDAVRNAARNSRAPTRELTVMPRFILVATFASLAAMPLAAQRSTSRRVAPAKPAAAADTGAASHAGPAYALDFQDQDIHVVLSALAEAGNLNMAYSNLPERKVTLRMGQPASRAEITDMIKGIAQANDLTVQTEGSLLQISGPAEVSPARQRAQQAQQAELKLYVYRLKHASATHAGAGADEPVLGRVVEPGRSRHHRRSTRGHGDHRRRLGRRVRRRGRRTAGRHHRRRLELAAVADQCRAGCGRRRRRRGLRGFRWVRRRPRRRARHAHGGTGQRQPVQHRRRRCASWANRRSNSLLVRAPRRTGR